MRHLSFLIAFVSIFLSASAQDKKPLIHASVGVTYTLLRHQRIIQDQYTGNGYYGTSVAFISNKVSGYAGIMREHNPEGVVQFQYGIFFSGALAVTDKTVRYNGIATEDTFTTQFLSYRQVMVELPVKIGICFSKKYPVQLSFGIVPAVPIVNSSHWNYTLHHSWYSTDANGNPITVHEISEGSSGLKRSVLAVGLNTGLRIPVIKIADLWLSFSCGVNYYLTSMTSFVHVGSGSPNVMRMTHTTLYGGISVPLNIGLIRDQIPTKSSLLPFE